MVQGRGWTLFKRFTDDGVSGATSNRPAFRAMLAAARTGRFDVLVVYKTDRLFRSLRELVTTLDELGELGVGFVSVTEPFDTTTSAGRLMMQIVGAFAEFERSILIERTTSGIAAARARGVVVGRPRVSVDVLEARRLRQARWSYARIAKRLGVGVGTLHRAMRE
jgi:DNA invertase Pin-like site-specific DNA recombinase